MEETPFESREDEVSEELSTEELAESNNILLSALIEVLIKKGFITQEELDQEAEIIQEEGDGDDEADEDDEVDADEDCEDMGASESGDFKGERRPLPETPQRFVDPEREGGNREGLEPELREPPHRPAPQTEYH